MLQVTLPCKPVVKQYLLNKYGPQLNLPEGDLVKAMIENLLHRNVAEQDTKITLQFYTETALIPISFKVYELCGDQLSKTAIRAINTTIEKKIHDRLYDFMEFFVYVAKFEQKDAIIMFQQIHGFPDDVYSTDAIKKYFQREIQPYLEKTLIKFASVNVPSKKPYRFRKVA